MKMFAARNWHRYFFNLLLILLFLGFASQHGIAAEKATGMPTDKLMKSDSPLHIASDRMEVMQNDKTILFEGHVVVQQDDLTITGNRLRVYGAQGDKSAAADKNKNKDKASQASQAPMMDKIDRIEVEGEVKITQKEKVASSDKAVYYHQDQKIVLIGHPSVSQGRDTVQGRLITLYLTQGRSVVEGGEETPVQAVLHPAKKE